MMDFVREVREVMEEANTDVKPASVTTPNRLFMPKQGADKQAAMKRYAAVESVLYDWHAIVNQTNYRELPEDLIDLYETACRTMLKIQAREKNIVMGGE